MKMPRLVCCLLLGILLYSGSHLPAQNETPPPRIDLDAYYSLLDELRRECFRAWEDSEAEELLNFIGRMPDSVRLSFKDNENKTQRKVVSNLWIKNFFEPNGGWESNTYTDTLERAQLLEALVKEYKAELHSELGSQPGDGDASQRAKDILADRDFRKDKKEEPRRGRSRANRGNREFERSMGNSGEWTYENLPWIFLVVIGILLLVLMATMGRNIDFAKTGEEVEVDINKGLLRKGDPTRSREMKEMAEQTLQSGEREAALRCYYLYFILLLHERKLIRYRSSWTNWEYFSEMIRKGVPRTEAFEITDMFDHVQYGREPVNEAELGHFLHNLDQSVLSLNQSSS